MTDPIVSILFGAILPFLLAVAYWYLSRAKNLPPGPREIPYLGYLPGKGEHLHQQFNKLAEKHGPVMSFHIMNRLMVVLNDFDSIKEAFVKRADVFSGRPAEMKWDILLERPVRSIIGEDGEPWKEHRRFALSTFRDYGMGKLSIEPLFWVEIEYFLAEVAKFGNGAICTNIAHLLANSISNNICILAFGDRFDYGDPRFVSLKKSLDVLFSSTGATSALRFFKWMRHVPFLRDWSGLQRFRQALGNIHYLCKDMVDQHEVQHESGQNEDYIHAFITERELRKRNGDATYFTDDRLVDNVRLFFIAGSETTTTTLCWALLYMTAYPDVQKKVQQELDEVIGRDRQPSYENRCRTPYAEATLNEIQRLGSIIPLNVLHGNEIDVNFRDYFIPKGSVIVSNLWSVHRDPKLWGDPENFRPERFLAADGTVTKPEYLIPFSIGKRFCLGEALARMELYLYFTALLQRFTFRCPPGETISYEGTAGLSFGPKVLRLVVEPRT